MRNPCSLTGEQPPLATTREGLCSSRDLHGQKKKRCSTGVTQGGTNTLISDSGTPWTPSLISKVQRERRQLHLLGRGPEETAHLPPAV